MISFLCLYPVSRRCGYEGGLPAEHLPEVRLHKVPWNGRDEPSATAVAFKSVRLWEFQTATRTVVLDA